MNRHPYYGAPALVGSHLGKLRLQVHHWLDARWKYGTETRAESYQWLAKNMGLSEKECHAGMFDEELCERAIAVLKAAL